MSPEEALAKAVELVGTGTRLAELLGVTKGAVGQWPARRVPAEHCPAIERITNGLVKCEQLRPDVDWPYLRLSIGPEENRRDYDDRRQDSRRADEERRNADRRAGDRRHSEEVRA